MPALYPGGGTQRLADLGDSDDPLQNPVPVDGNHGPKPPKPLSAQQGLKRLALVNAHGQIVLKHVDNLQGGPPRGDLSREALGANDPQKVPRGIDNSKPRPAIAPKELLLSVYESQIGGNGDGLTVHDVGDGKPIDALPHRPLHDGHGGPLVDEEPDENKPNPRGRTTQPKQSEPAGAKQNGEPLTGTPGGPCGAIAILGEAPNQESARSARRRAEKQARG